MSRHQFQALLKVQVAWSGMSLQCVNNISNHEECQCECRLSLQVDGMLSTDFFHAAGHVAL